MPWANSGKNRRNYLNKKIGCVRYRTNLMDTKRSFQMITMFFAQTENKERNIIFLQNNFTWHSSTYAGTFWCCVFFWNQNKITMNTILTQAQLDDLYKDSPEEYQFEWQYLNNQWLPLNNSWSFCWIFSFSQQLVGLYR